MGVKLLLVVYTGVVNAHVMSTLYQLPAFSDFLLRLII